MIGISYHADYIHIIILYHLLLRDSMNLELQFIFLGSGKMLRAKVFKL